MRYYSSTVFFIGQTTAKCSNWEEHSQRMVHPEKTEKDKELKISLGEDQKLEISNIEKRSPNSNTSVFEK
jgi:hypothetical protein